MSEWRTITLGDLGTVERGRSRHRPRNDPALYGGRGDTPFFQTGDVKMATLHMTKPTQWYSEAGVLQSRVWEPGITCITIAANIAETAILGVRGCFPDSVLGFTPSIQASDAYFVKYLLDFYRAELTSRARGTAQDNLSLEKLMANTFLAPDATTRAQIVAVLRSFDDLIENNQRQTELLDQMARLIYQEWFANHRFPGYEQCDFVDSAVGRIPSSWQVKNLFDVAEVGFGFSFKSNRFSEAGPYPVIRIRDIPTGTTKTFTDEEPTSRYAVHDGDVLIGMDGDFHLRQWTGGDAWLNQRVVRLRPQGALSARHLMLALEEPIRQWNTAIIGTTVAHLGKSHLEQINVALPTDQGTLESLSQVLDYFARAELVVTHQTRSLIRMRDLLTPKLIGGQIQVGSLDLNLRVRDAVA